MLDLSDPEPWIRFTVGSTSNISCDAHVSAQRQGFHPRCSSWNSHYPHDALRASLQALLAFGGLGSRMAVRLLSALYSVLVALQRTF